MKINKSQHVVVVVVVVVVMGWGVGGRLACGRGRWCGGEGGDGVVVNLTFLLFLNENDKTNFGFFLYAGIHK